MSRATLLDRLLRKDSREQRYKSRLLRRRRPGIEQLEARNLLVSNMLGAIAGTVFQDTNGDMIADAPLGGADVDLFEDANNDDIPDGPAITTTMSAPDGTYLFSDLDDGRYIVRQQAVAGFENPVPTQINDIVITEMQATMGDLAIQIDTFDLTTQEVIAKRSGPTTDTDVAIAPEAIGNSRQLFVSAIPVLPGGEDVRLDADFQSLLNRLDFGAETGLEGLHRVTWDGDLIPGAMGDTTNADPLPIPGGTAGDLTMVAGLPTTGIFLNAGSDNGPGTTVRFVITSTSGAIATVQKLIPSTGPAALPTGEIYIPFTDPDFMVVFAPGGENLNDILMSAAAIQADINNPLSVDGTLDNIKIVTVHVDEDNDFVNTLRQVDTPMIDVTKFVNGEDANNPSGPTVGLGTAVTFTYEVTTGGSSVPLTNVNVRDDNGTPAIPGDDFDASPVENGGFNVGDTGPNGMNGLLDPGETWQYVAIRPAVLGLHTNIATATGEDQQGAQAPPAMDPANYTGVALSLGNQVWLDVNMNGVFDGPDTGIDGVDLVLWEDINQNGVIDPIVDIIRGNQTTAGGGQYLFTGLEEGKYIVQVVPGNFNALGPLDGLLPTTPQVADPNNDVNNDNNGLLAGGFGVASGNIMLNVGLEPTGPANNENLTLDFGFVPPAGLPDLAIQKTDGGITTMPGGQIVYVITYENIGPVDANGVFLTEIVPANATSIDAINALLGWSTSDGGVTYTKDIGTVAPSEVGMATFVVMVDNPLPPVVMQIDNLVVIDDDGTEQNKDNNTATEDTPLDSVPATPDLEIVKLDGGVTTQPGGVVTYLITAQNVSQTTATGVVITETVPDNASSVDAINLPLGWVTNDGGVTYTFDVGVLLPTEMVNVNFVVIVDDPFPPAESMITNKVTVMDDGQNGPDPTPDNNMDTEDTPVITPDVPNYVIAKTASDVDSAGNGVIDNAGEVIDYVITLINTGAVDLTGVTVSDPLLGALLGPIESGLNNNILDVGETWIYTGSYVVTQADIDSNATLEPDNKQPVTIDNTVTSTTNEISVPKFAMDMVPIDQDPNYTIVKRAIDVDGDGTGNGPVTAAGQIITYQVDVLNTGNQTITGVTLNDSLVAMVGMPTESGGNGVNGDGLLDVGETWTWTYTYTVTQGDIDSNGGGDGDIDNVAIVDSNELPPETDDEDVPIDQRVGSIAGFVWLDMDDDGVFDASEMGIQGVDVTLMRTDGGIFPPVTIQTDANGFYIFTDLPAGTYKLTETQPIVFADGKDRKDPEGLPGLAGDDMFVEIALGGGQDLANYNFGELLFSKRDFLSPNIDIEKATNGEDADLPDGPIVPVGDPVLFTYEVTNPGSAPLSNITVVDDNGTPGDPLDVFNPIPVLNGLLNVGDLDMDNKLDPGEAWQYTAVRTATLGLYTNVATVTGRAPATGQIVTDSDASNHLGEGNVVNIRGDEPDVVFVIDISGSTSGSFGGTSVGDANSDGSPDQIIDAEIKGFEALNKLLIDQGFGDIGDVAVVAFESIATKQDMDPIAGGVQVATKPNADLDVTSILDVDEVLRKLDSGGGTNFDAALKAACEVFTELGTDPANANVIFLSDGQASVDQQSIDDLRAKADNIRAFGVGPGASLNALLEIDPLAEIFNDTDELLAKFGGLP